MGDQVERFETIEQYLRWYAKRNNRPYDELRKEYYKQEDGDYSHIYN